MKEQHMSQRIVFAVAVAACVALTGFARPTSAPSLNQGAANDRVVSGRAAPGSDPLKIYDITHSTRIPISQGQTTMDSEGNFAVSVDPPLVAGHRIVAVDKHGRSSAPITVQESDPASGPRP
jgi:hypothetical protein